MGKVPVKVRRARRKSKWRAMVDGELAILKVGGGEVAFVQSSAPECLFFDGRLLPSYTQPRTVYSASMTTLSPPRTDSIALDANTSAWVSEEGSGTSPKRQIAS